MRKFRAIIETHIEPEDHEVLWYYKGKLLYWGNEAWEPFLLVDAIEIPYKTEEDKSITTVQGALDKLLYVVPEITSFTLNEAGTYERGTVISELNFSWDYNKELIREQRLDSMIVPTSVREAILMRNVRTDTTFTLYSSDGTNQTSATTSIKFVDYIYYGKVENPDEKFKLKPSESEFTITSEDKEHIWIFIPNTSGLTKVWNDNVESTDAFIHYSMVYNTDTGLNVAGTYYVSKHSGLGTITLKIT